MQYLFRYLFLFISFSFIYSQPAQANRFYLTSIYYQIQGEFKPDLALFERAYLGYIDLRLSGMLNSEKEILSIIDFRKPSDQKRLWVIDLETKTVLFHTYVAHGINSGKENYAIDFSNEVGSFQSSLGFFITDKTYVGKNGLSLKLKGVEHDFNSNSLERYIVLHGAKYAEEAYLKKHGKLGNSEGCPAIPMEIHKPIINLTKFGTCLFIYFPDAKYLENSSFILDYY